MRSNFCLKIAPPRLRGILLSGLAFFIVAMQTVGLGVVRAFVPDIRPSAFRTIFALQWVVGGLPIIAFFLAPEYVFSSYPVILLCAYKIRSPNYLLLKGRADAARKSIARLYGQDNHIDARLAHLQSGIRHETKQDQKASYLDCFKGTDRKRTLTVCLLMFGNGLTGTAFLTQNIYFLTLAGLPVIHCFDINIGGFALALILMPIAWYFVDRVGRRPLYLIGVGGNVLFLAAVGGLGYVPSANKGATWTIAVLL
jgi:hypothetical protein